MMTTPVSCAAKPASTRSASTVRMVDAPFVSNDDEASMELSLNHLVHLGHQRIGLAVGPQRYVPSQRKIAGYHRFMTALLGEEDVDDLVETEMYTVEGGQAAAQRLVEKGCTAIVFGSASQAIKLRNEIQAADERYAQIRLAMDRMVSELSVAFLSELVIVGIKAAVFEGSG